MVHVPNSSRPKVWSGVFILTIVITFFAFVAGQGLNTGMSVYVEHQGGTATFAGLLMAVFSASAAVSRIVVGPAIDTRGRRTIMVAGSAVLAVGVLLPGVIPGDTSLVVGRLLQGVGFASATTAAATAAADTLPQERMAEGISYYGLGQALATSVGPAFALFLIGTDPAENLFYVLSAVAGVTMVLAGVCGYERRLSMLPKEAVYRQEHEANADSASCAADEEFDGKMPESPPEGKGGVREGAEGARAHSAPSAKLADADATAPKEPRGISRIFEPRALPGAVPMLFMSAAFGFAVSFAGLYGESLGIANAGVFYTCSAVSMIVIRFASKPLMEALLPIQTFALAVACGVAAFAMLLASGSNELLFYGAGLFYGVCLGISLPLNQSVAVKNTPPERWGATNALYLLASDIGIGGASVIWGATNDLFGFSFTICCVIGCVLVSYALAWAVYPQSAKRRSAARRP